MRLPLLASFLVLAACTESEPALDADYIVWGSSGSTVTVGWVPIDGASSFTIERGSSEADLAPIATLAPPETSFLDTGLAPLTPYTYRFSYLAADGSTVVEPVQEAYTTDEEILVTGEPTPVGAPVITTVGATGSAIAVDATNATVVVPPGAVPDGTEVTIQPIASPYPDDDAPGVLISSSAPFAQPVDLVFAYDEIDALEPEHLTIAVQADDGSWISQPRVIDREARTVTHRFPATTARAGLVNLHGAVLLRATYVLPRMATVKVNQELGLHAWGVFSDSPLDDPSAARPAVAITIGLIIARQMNLRDMRRPARRTVRLLENTAPGFERIWTVEHVINGNGVVGTIATPFAQGARYTAPAAKPASNPVAVRFTSVTVSGDDRLPTTPVPAIIEIDDPGSVRITGTFRLDGTAIPCPVGYVDVTDTFSFSVTLDDQLEFRVEAIENQPTVLGPLRVEQPVSSAAWTQQPEVFTMTGGSASEDPVTHKLIVDITGNWAVGSCSYVFDGQPPVTVPGTAMPVALGLAIDPQSLYVSTNDSIWRYSAVEVGGP
jgi:hypothetical protein